MYFRKTDPFPQGPLGQRPWFDSDRRDTAILVPISIALVFFNTDQGDMSESTELESAGAKDRHGYSYCEDLAEIKTGYLR